MPLLSLTSSGILALPTPCSTPLSCTVFVHIHTLHLLLDLSLDLAQQGPGLEGRLVQLPWSQRDLAYGHEYFLENVVDPAHVPVSHHNVAGGYGQSHY